MVLGKLLVPGRPTIWITVGQGPTAPLGQGLTAWLGFWYISYSSHSVCLVLQSGTSLSFSFPIWCLKRYVG